MRFTTEVLANAPAAAAWELLAERFGDIARWSGGIDESFLKGDLGVGAQRVCKSSTSFGPFPPSVVTEHLTQFDRDAMEFTYVARDGLPSFIRTASNHWTVVPIDEGSCRVVSRAQVQMAWWAVPLGWLMPLFLQADMARFSDELRHAVESVAAA